LVREPGAPQPIGALTGDFLFVGALGRPDLLEVAANVADTMRPSAKALYASATMFQHEANGLLIWPGHGAGSACGKSLGSMPHSSLGYEKAVNPGLQAAGRGEDAFIDHILAAQTEPPMYFARMKKLNKEGPPRLGRLPVPDRMGLAELKRAAADGSLTFLDTRTHRGAVLRAHLPGALFAPLNAMFATVVGSLIADSEMPIVLVVGEGTWRRRRAGWCASAMTMSPASWSRRRCRPISTRRAIGRRSRPSTSPKPSSARARPRSSMCAAAPNARRPMFRAPSMRPIRGCLNMSMTCRPTASFWCTAGRGRGPPSPPPIWRAPAAR
jgi:hypothetical protein